MDGWGWQGLVAWVGFGVLCCVGDFGCKVLRWELCVWFGIVFMARRVGLP